MEKIEDMLLASISKLMDWVEAAGYKAYEPFDGLSSFLRPLTFYKKFPQQCLQQFVLRFPVNSRPLLGISKKHSSKAMGFFARGFLRLYKTTGDESFLAKCRKCLDWLIANHTEGYSGLCWGNAFDYQSRAFYLPEGVPTVVWVGLIGHAFVDAYEALKINKYKNTALSCGNFILNDLPRSKKKEGECISYVPFKEVCIHNSNLIAAALLSRLYGLTRDEKYYLTARKAVRYSISCQHDDGSWYYGEDSKFRWIDSWHTAYNLDSIKHYCKNVGDDSFLDNYKKGVQFYINNFFREDGAPNYYWDRLKVIDIQCAGQALDSLVFFSEEFPEAIKHAKNIAEWSIKNMQDKNGYFYFRRYKYSINKAPMLHWGQATMFSGLSSLYLHLKKE